MYCVYGNIVEYIFAQNMPQKSVLGQKSPETAPFP